LGARLLKHFAEATKKTAAGHVAFPRAVSDGSVEDPSASTGFDFVSIKVPYDNVWKATGV